ncbi:MAG: transglycosylase SLT domain-containing protein [Synechococcus sp.]
MVGQHNASSCCCGLPVRPSRGLLLLTSTTIASLSLILVAQHTLQRWQTTLTPAARQDVLWKRYRWGWDPSERRNAALLLAASDPDSPRRRQRLLQGQAWGQAQVAAAVLVQQARTASQLGEPRRAKARWQALLTRFPHHPLSADAAYQLSGDDAALRRWLLKHHPAHPAALERAVHQHQAVHLARWGPNHPGGGAVIRAACEPKANTPPADREQLAFALAKLGDGRGGLDCLQGATPAPATAVALGRSLLRGDAGQRRQGEALLVELTQTANPTVSASTLEAARLLSETGKPAPAVLEALPQALRTQSADVAAAEVRLGQRSAASVFSRWPNHPASWQLQWDLARADLLAGRWAKADTWLEALTPKQLPEPLAARQRFWRGLSAAKQGRQQAATAHWQALLTQHPPGYYHWRASVRLGEANLPRLTQTVLLPPKQTPWQPLNSGDPVVEQLWRLEMVLDALEIWHSRHRAPLDPQTLAAEPTPQARITEGRLLLAAGDPWRGLETLWRSSLRLVGEDCSTRIDLHQRQHPQPFPSAFSAASKAATVHEALLRAIAKQESRYSTGVQSAVGAQGLMQLMPATAADLAGKQLQTNELIDPDTNTRLGARYLQLLLQQWNDNPWLAVASYNAGPGAAGGWRSPELEVDPELWAERIPYPETRIYTKKVLGNLWAYLQHTPLACPR